MRCLGLDCSREATFGEYLFLDWGRKKGDVWVYQVASCQDCRVGIREEIVKIFSRRAKASKANPLVCGSIFHVIPTGRKAGEHRVVIWSDCKDFRSWDKARRMWTSARHGKFYSLLGKPRYVNRYDWRGWSVKNQGPKYDLQPLEHARYGFPYVHALVYHWCQQLPDDWTPTLIEDLPPQSPPL